MERIWLAVCLGFMLRMMIMMMLLRLSLSLYLYCMHTIKIGNHSKLGEPKRIHWTNKLIDTFLYFAVLFTIASSSFIHSLVLFGWFGWLNFQVRDNLSYVCYTWWIENSIEQTNYQASQKRSAPACDKKHKVTGMNFECKPFLFGLAWTNNANIIIGGRRHITCTHLFI